MSEPRYLGCYESGSFYVLRFTFYALRFTFHLFTRKRSRSSKTPETAENQFPKKNPGKAENRLTKKLAGTASRARPQPAKK
jgi:hypothetical protein